MTDFPKRGEIWLVNFDPTLGSEIKKTRPALILQNNIGNQYSQITIVAALSTQFAKKLYPTEVLIKPPEAQLEQPSVVLLNQIRSLDKQRLIHRLGEISQPTQSKVNQALEISLGLVEL